MGIEGAGELSAHVGDLMAPVGVLTSLARPLWTLGQVAGGLALFLYGMQLVRSALREGGAGRLRAVLQVLARHRASAALAGVLLTMVLSSSATAGVLLVGLVDAGVLEVPQALAVMLGSAIGTTLTVQLFAFRVGEWALLILALGFFITLAARYTRTRQAGSVLMGIGLIFLGVTTLSAGVRPLVEAVGVERLDHLATSGWAGPLLVLVAATGLAAVLMNSAAVVVVAFALVDAGLSLRSALPIVFGANIGTCAGQLIAALLGGRAGRQLALGHLLFKVAGVLLFLPFLGSFSRLVQGVTGWMVGAEQLAGSLRRAVANAHTIFNLVNTAIFLPLLGLLVRVVRWLAPEAPSPPPGTLQHIDYRYLARPELALERAHREVLRMGRLTCENLERVFPAVERDDSRAWDDIERRDDLIDLLDEILTDYLARLTDEELPRELLAAKQKLLCVVKDFEHIGDFVSKEMVLLGRKKAADDVPFAMAEQAELRRLHQRVARSFTCALAFLEGAEPAAADTVLDFERNLDSEQRDLYHRHLERLSRGVTESRASSSVFIDLVSLYRTIHGYLADVVRVLEWPGEAAASTFPGRGEGPGADRPGPVGHKE